MGTFVGCDKASSAPGSPAASAADDHDDHDHAPAEPGVVSITSDVRENLGITFAQVEMRHVASTIRVPGRFEARPDAVREYRAPLAGRVELLVKQYDRVTTGTPLYRLDSAEWRRMQQEYVSAKAEVLVTSASLMAAQVASSGGGIAAQVTQNRVDAAEAHIDGLLASIKLAEEREKQVKRLHEIVGGRMSELVEARSQLASLRNSLNQAKEDRAELEQQRLQLSTDNSGGSFGTSETLEASAAARRAEYDATYARLYLLRANLESIQPDQGPLRDNLTHPSSWEIRPIITVRATAEGTISSVGVTSGAFLDISASVVTTVDEQRVRFRGVALQSDLHQLEGELPGSILMPGKSNAYGVVAVFLAESPGVFRNLAGLFGMGEYQPPVISIASMVGFVTLFGIAVRNGILLVNHYQDLRRDESLPVLEAVLRGSNERLVPIIMTALTAILGLIPLAMASGEPGSELLSPLAVVVLGGLISSTILNLFVVPAGYVMIFGGKRQNSDTIRIEKEIL